jgi:hypothetical protein
LCPEFITLSSQQQILVFLSSAKRILSQRWYLGSSSSTSTLSLHLHIGIPSSIFPSGLQT